MCASIDRMEFNCFLAAIAVSFEFLVRSGGEKNTKYRTSCNVGFFSSRIRSVDSGQGTGDV